jgi:hypothetical protein
MRFAHQHASSAISLSLLAQNNGELWTERAKLAEKFDADLKAQGAPVQNPKRSTEGVRTPKSPDVSDPIKRANKYW